MTTTRTRLIAAACAVGLTAAGLTACSDSGDNAKDVASSAASAADKAGDAAVDGSKKAQEGASQAAADAEDAAKEAADAAKEAADKTGDAAKDAADKAGDKAQEALDSANKAADDAKKAAENGGADASKAAQDAVDAAKKAATDASSDAKKAADNATADLGEGDMVEVADANGAKLQVPVALNKKATELGAGTLGKLTAVKHSGDNWVASYTSGWHIAYSEATGAQPVKGKIGQVWFDNGNITNPVGMPTAAEQTKPNNEGWTQNFTNGEIWAGMDGTSGTNTK